MDIKKIIYYLLFIVSILLLVLGVKGHNYLNQVNIGACHFSLKSTMDTDKKKYQLNDTITISMLYKRIDNSNKKVGINLCSSDNSKVNVRISQFVPPNYKNFFPKKYWIDNPSYERRYGEFILNCPEDLKSKKGLVFFEVSQSYKFNFKVKFIKENNKYFLVDINNNKMQIKQSSNYYSFEIYFKEGIFSSENIDTYCLGKYVYMKINEKDILELFISDYNICF